MNEHAFRATAKSIGEIFTSEKQYQQIANKIESALKESSESSKM